MTNPVAISDVRANLPKLVDDVAKNFDRVVITVNGDPKAVMLSMEELEALEETSEVLAIPRIKEDIKKSRSQIKKGQFTNLKGLK